MRPLILVTTIFFAIVELEASCCNCDCYNPHQVQQFYYAAPQPQQHLQLVPVIHKPLPVQPVLNSHSHQSSQILSNIDHSHAIKHNHYDIADKKHVHGKDDHDAHYKFEYSVHDQKTHDIKQHKEERSGDVVKGEYSLVEDDGNVRTVKYYADWKTGFHAQVLNSKKG